MVDLARQAFKTKNFELAAEIYDRSIRENGPTAGLYLGLADSFARTGHFSKAFGAYTNAFRLGCSVISPQKLKHLVTALVETVDKESMSANLAMIGLRHGVFDCLLCRNLLNDPVTIPCGHSFCRTCLQKDRSKTCKNCGIVHHHLNVTKLKSSVLLSQSLEKWFPSQCKAARLKEDANSALAVWNLEDAIRLYTEAIDLAPGDHLLWSNRSHAFTKLDRFNEALTDASMVVKLRPDWPKGYFRRGVALHCLSRYDEAVVSLLQCLALDTSLETAKDYLAKALHSILSVSSMPPDDPKSVARQQQLNPSMLEQLIQTNFSSSLLLPQVSMEKVAELKSIIKETVATAAEFVTDKYQDMNPHSSQDVDIDDTASALPSYMQTGEGSRCQSAPASRTNSPLPFKAWRSRSFDSVQTMCHSGIESEQTFQGQTADQSLNQATDEEKVGLPPVAMELRKQEDFECSLCYRLLFMPVTTPCGHTFCRHCLDRSLDHRIECPLCKSSLTEYLAERRQAVSSAVDGVLQGFFQQEYEQRKEQHAEEIADMSRMDTQHEVPIFVCTMAYPTVGCPLHIFEPRYRLMIRQSMESGRRQFGMCVATGDEEHQFAEYGCMLEIRDVQFFPDGRSIVDTVGGKRFKVLSRGHKDGYDTAKVEFLSDVQPEGQELADLRKRSDSLYEECRNWFDSLPLVQKQQMLQHLGPFPDAEMETDQVFGPNGPAWHWYMIAVLPLDPRIQLTMVAMVSYKERLKGLQRVMSYLHSRRTSQ